METDVAARYQSLLLGKRAHERMGTSSLNTGFVVPSTRETDITAIRYGLLSQREVHEMSVLPCRRGLGQTSDYGVNDPRLGVCDRMGVCRTCGKRGHECVGHAGHIDLEAPVFHLGLFPIILRVCRTVCKNCAHVLLTHEEKTYYHQRLKIPLSSLKSGTPALEPQQRDAIIKQIQEDAYKTRVCPHCGAVNGVVRKLKSLRMVHERYKVGLRRGEIPLDKAQDYVDQLRTGAAAQSNKDVELNAAHVQDFLDPVRVRALFAAIPARDYDLLGFQPTIQQASASPENLVLSSLVVPPVCVRPNGISPSTRQIREDDLTALYNEILTYSDALRDGANDVSKYVERWEALQVEVAKLMDASVPGFPLQHRSVECKSYAQRMKGKHGRFRGNLSGKRVDFSGRSVISPDPNLAIDELAIPLRIARVLSYPQKVFAHNIELMRRLVRNGPDVHPGAVTVYLAREGTSRALYNPRDRQLIASRLSVGDIVERHIMNGDLILFNRQPSLHRISMMAHRARVLPYMTLRFNECCCSPYNADFDGDEMNVHVVQTEEARAEAKNLMLTSSNIITAKNGEPIIACTQDFLTAAYLVTSRDILFDRAQFSVLVSHWLSPTTRVELPIPAILKPVERWTGKQLMEMIIRPSPAVSVSLTFEAKTRVYSGKLREQDPNEGFVSFHDTYYVSGRMDKKILGGGAKDGLFARLYAQTGGAYTATCMSRIAKFTSRYLQNYGFSLGLGDVAPTPSLNERKVSVLQASFAKCDALIQAAKTGRMTPIPGMTVKQTLEAKLNAELSSVRNDCGSAAVNTLDSRVNAPMIMVNSGSKGSELNTAQMMACVGQQTVSGKRIVNAFQYRSLPHFMRFAEHPAARGFVASSFFSGLSPTEFFFHTMAGREGLVDTAVKTAETGYIYRRLSKAMENLTVEYDGTVRHTSGGVVQLRYGEDGMDPWLMEGSHGTPLNLDLEWMSEKVAHAERKRRVLASVREAAATAAVADAGKPATKRARRKATAAVVVKEEEEEVEATPAAAAVMTEAEAVQRYCLSMAPEDVMQHVTRCLDGDAGVLALCEELGRQERAALLASSPAPSRQAAATPKSYLRRLATTSSPQFRQDVREFFQRKVEEQRQLRAHLGLPVAVSSRGGGAAAAVKLENENEEAEEEQGQQAKATAGRKRGRKPSANHKSGDTAAAGQAESPAERMQAEMLPLTISMVTSFLERCASKYIRKSCEPGTPCGAIAAQSVGEPSTQMTLRTFHFAGVASMNITQGVPRLVEVINANKNISTPVVTAPIVLNVLGGPARDHRRASRIVRGMVERVLLKEIVSEMVEVISAHRYYVHIFLDMPRIRALEIPVDAGVVRQRLLLAAARPMSPLRRIDDSCIEIVSQDSLLVYPFETEPALMHFCVQQLLVLLPELVVGGMSGINRVMLSDGGRTLLAEGTELRSVMVLPYVDGTRTMCNHVAVVERTLGIEAARQCIVNEITEVLKAYSLNIDIRHLYLLADVMTSRGSVLGITRYGIQKMSNNVLTLASFERTTDHLYHAAATNRSDVQLGVSESIIIGKPIPLGTAAFSLLLDEKAASAPQRGVLPAKTFSSAYGSSVPISASEWLKRSSLRSGGHEGRRYSPLSADGAFHLDIFV